MVKIITQYLIFIFIRMTPRQKRIVEKFRKGKPRDFKNDTDEEILLYLGEIKKLCPWINFDAWLRGEKLFKKV